MKITLEVLKYFETKLMIQSCSINHSINLEIRSMPQNYLSILIHSCIALVEEYE